MTFVESHSSIVLLKVAVGSIHAHCKHSGHEIELKGKKARYACLSGET